MARFSVLPVLIFLLLQFSLLASALTGPTVLQTSVLGKCPAMNQTQYVTSNGTYLIGCGIDYYGGDMKGTGQKATTFQMCLDRCAATRSCIALSYQAPACYLKSTILPTRVGKTVVGAKLISGPLLSSTTSSSSTSSTSTSSSKSSSTSSTTSSSQSTSGSSTSTSSTSTPAPSSTSTSSSAAATASTVTTPVDSYGGNETIYSGEEYVPGPDPVTLGPIAPFGMDMTSLDRLTPSISSGLYYSGGSDSSDNSTTSGTVAKLTVTFKYPSVILDQSVFVSSSCSKGVLTATFSKTAAFSQAQSTWPSTTFILVTAASSCSPDGQNVFFLTNSVTFSATSLTAVASGSIVELADVFTDLGVDFGSVPNSSSNTSISSDVCGSPDTSPINGLPAVACGSAFDQTLDDSLGYYSGADADISSVMSIIAPGLDTSTIQRRSLGSLLKKYVAPAIKAVVKKAVQVAAPYVQKIVPKVLQKAALSLAKTVTTIATKVVSLLSGSFSKSLNIPIKIGPSTTTLSDSPWGKQLKFYEYHVGQKDPKYTAQDAALGLVQGKLVGEPNPVPGVELFCVDCGINGTIKLIGTVGISATQGFYQGSLSMQGNLYAGAFIGVNAFAEYQKNLDIPIIKQGLPGFSIPKVITIGPSVALGIRATLDVQAIGQVLTGTSFSWPAISATLDVIDKTKSQRSGFAPVVTRKFDVYGDITATASLGLPLTLAFGVDVLNGKWKKEISLEDIPSVVATAEASFSLGTSGNSITTNNCNGISWNVNVANELDLNIGDDIQYTLWSWVGPNPITGCIGTTVADSTTSSSMPSTSTSSSSTSTSTTSTSTSSSSTSTSMTSTSSSSSTSTSSSSTKTTSTSVSTYSTVLYISALPTTSSSLTSASSTVLYISALSTTSTSMTSASSTVLYISPLTTTSTTLSSTSSTSSSSSSTSSSSSSSTSSMPYTATTVPVPTVTAGINCPADNGKNVTDSLGYVYQIECNVVHAGDDMTPLAVSSFQQCLVQCFEATNHDCIAISFAPNWQTNCYLKSDKAVLPSPSPDSTVGGTVHSAKLVSAPPCTSMTCPLNNGQYCSSNSELFKIDCAVAYGTTALSGFNFKTLGECVDACSSIWPGVCNGVSFFAWAYTVSTGIFIGPQQTNCFPFIAANNPVTGASANNGWSVLSISARSAGSGLNKRETPPSPSEKFVRRRAINPAEKPLQRRQSIDTSDVTTYVPIFDTTNQLSLNAATNGNLFVALANDASQSTNITFSLLDNAINGDSTDRLLVYYPDEMAAVGSSRVRLAAWGSIPKTSQLISFVPFNTGSGTILVAVDTLGNSFWLFVCSINNQQNKVFLVQNSDTGEALLEDPGLKFTVTGGVVNDCSALAMTVAGMQYVA